jgi:hypothetical protein
LGDVTVRQSNKLQAIDREIAVYLRAWSNAADRSTRAVLETQISRVIHDRARIIGLEEDEILKIKARPVQEVEALFDAELENALSALEKSDNAAPRKLGTWARHVLRSKRRRT